MAHTRNTFTLIFIFALFFIAQCSKVSSARTPASTPTPTPGPSSDEEASSSDEEASSPQAEASLSEEEASSPQSDASSSEEEASSPTEDTSSSDDDTSTSTDDAPSSDKDTSSNKDSSISTDDDEETPSSLTPTSEPTADSPMSLRELFEISLPNFGLNKAQVALNPEGAKVTIKQLEGIEHRIYEFKAIITKRQANSKASEWTKKCLTQCQDNFEDAIDGVKISIESINNQDLEKANVDISGISTDIETCNDCFVELEGEDKEINTFSEWVKGVTKECLSNIKTT